MVPWIPADPSVLKVPRTPLVLKVPRTLWALKVLRTLWAPAVLPDPTDQWMPADLWVLKAPHPPWVLVDLRHLRVSTVFAAQWDLRRPEDLWVPREFRKLSPSEISTASEEKLVDSRTNVVVATACQLDNPTDPLLVTVDVPQETLSMAPVTTSLARDPAHTEPAAQTVVTRAPAPPHTQTVTDTLADMEAPGEQFAHLAFPTRATTLVRKT